MKKILHIQVLPKLSGVQKISLEILKALPSDYEKFILFGNSLDCGDKQDCIKQFQKAGVKVLFLDELHREICLQDFKACYKIYKLCKKEKFDIVHTNSTKPGIIGRIAATLAHTRLVVHTVHGLSFHKFIKFPKWQFYWMCEMFASFFCHKIVLVNQFYSKYFRFFKNKVSTIYNGIDFSCMPTPIPLEPATHKRILFVGRLDTPKNPITLLKAANIVLKKYPCTVFTLVGDGEKFNECQNFIKQNNLQNNIKLEGWQKDTYKYYQQNDIFAMSSIYESFGLIFLEASFYKLPIIATNVEGIPEVVKDKETGLLCDPLDHQALANNIITLIESPSLCNELGTKGQERALSLFNSQRMVNEYLSLYETAFKND